MSFLNQALLFGLLAVSIPVIIHLLNRRRFRKVRWAAMRFLQVSVEKNQRRMKLEDLILLLLRCALLAILALAMARPVVEALRGLPGSKVSAVVVVDNSASMSTLEGDRTRLDVAREAAETVVAGLPSGSSVAISTPFRPDEPTSEEALVARRIASIEQTHRHGDLLGALENAQRILEGQSAAEQALYLITDGQAEDWSSFSTLHEKLREISMGQDVNVILVGSAANANLGITRTAPSGALPAVGQPFRIDVDITNFGEAAAAEVPVRVLVDGRPAGEPWVIDEILPGRSESATVYATLPGAGYHRVTALLESDAVPFDDQRTVVLRAVEDVRVLLVDGDPGAEPRESEVFFLRIALTPVEEEGRASYPVKPSVVSASELAGEDLADYEVVILANVADLPLATAEELAMYVKAGGGMVIFPGNKVRSEFYNSVLHTRHRLLPARFESQGSEGDPQVRSLVPVETNPLELDAEMLSEVSVRRIVRVDAGASTGASRVVLRYDDGAAALVESEVGLGKVLLFTSTADLAWNDLAVKPAFVPFVNRLVGRIVHHRESTLNIGAGEILRHRVDPALAGEEATVYEVDDPEARGQLTKVEADGERAELRFADTQRAGAYQVTFEGDGSPLLFAAQASARESSLDLLGTAQVDRLADAVKVTRWGTGSGANQLAASAKGSELWLLLLVLVIVLAALELVLAQWFSRSK